MKSNITGQPTSITVDGKFYEIAHAGMWLRVYFGKGYNADFVDSKTFAGLADAIRSHLAVKKETNEAAKARAIAVSGMTGTKVFAYLTDHRTAHEIVQVRGISQKTSKYLITRQDGTKESASGSLMSLDTDIVEYDRLTKEIQALNEESKGLGESFYDLQRELRDEVIEIVYQPDTDDYRGTYGDHTYAADNSYDIERYIENAVKAERLPWMIDEKTVKASTPQLIQDSYSSTGYHTREEAQHALDVSTEMEQLRTQRSAVIVQFEYNVEQAKAAS